MPPPVFRFRIENQSGEKSQDWRIWAQRDDIYASSRGIANTYKASFHASGECHVGLTSEVRRSLVDETWTGKSRHFSKWVLETLDANEAPQNLVTILFPDSYLGPAGSSVDSKTTIIKGSKESITAVSIFRTHSHKDINPESDNVDFAVLFRVGLPCGQDLVVTKLSLAETPEYRQAMKATLMSQLAAQRTVSGRTYGSRIEGIPGPEVRAMLWNGTQQIKYWSEITARKLIISDAC